jgi:arsenate reductase
MANRPTVLFACVRNAGRSQMAAALMDRHGGGRIEVRSAGSEPASAVHPEVVEAMAEVGLDVAGERPRKLTDESVAEADVVVTMGCGDECPFHPGRRYEDWELDDPAGRDLAEVRAIRDEIERRVKALAGELLAAPERA